MVAIARPKDGVSLNNLEYVVYPADNPLGKPEGMVIVFRSVESARKRLHDEGMTDDDIKAAGILFILVEKILCPKCKKEIELTEIENGEMAADCECGHHESPVNWYSAIPVL